MGLVDIKTIKKCDPPPICFMWSRLQVPAIHTHPKSLENLSFASVKHSKYPSQIQNLAH